MTENTSKFSEEELHLMEMRQNGQLYSYDLTQKLTFFIISIELIFCGYILLNAEKLGAIQYSSILFALSGIGAMFGILWRVCYNQTYHDIAHGKRPVEYKFYKKVQNIAYWIYIPCTMIFLIGIVVIGFGYLNKIENKKKIEIINLKMKGIENSINNISNSIDKIANIKPKFEIVVPIHKAKESTNKEGNKKEK